MQQNVVVVSPDKLRSGESRTGGTVVGTRKQGKFTWTVRVIRGGPPADRRVTQPELQRRV